MYYVLYIDPGSGSMIVQLLIAGVLGVLYFFRSIRVGIVNFFKRVLRK